MNATVMRVFPIEWDSYFKCFKVRFRVKCPACGRICKHGQGFSAKPSKITIQGSRQCDHCKTEYRVSYQNEVA